MAMGRVMKIRLILLALLTTGCVSGHCRKAMDVPAAPAEDKTADASVSDESHIFVFKPDGSKQCGDGKGVPVQTMKAQLKNIKIFSSKKQKDGLMHIQVCGSATGYSNVFEIMAKDLPAAEKANFKKWLY
jgi:hypothetical protein